MTKRVCSQLKMQQTSRAPPTTLRKSKIDTNTRSRHLPKEYLFSKKVTLSRFVMPWSYVFLSHTGSYFQNDNNISTQSFHMLQHSNDNVHVSCHFIHILNERMFGCQRTWRELMFSIKSGFLSGPPGSFLTSFLWSSKSPFFCGYRTLNGLFRPFQIFIHTSPFLFHCKLGRSTFKRLGCCLARGSGLAVLKIRVDVDGHLGVGTVRVKPRVDALGNTQLADHDAQSRVHQCVRAVHQPQCSQTTSEGQVTLAASTCLAAIRHGPWRGIVCGDSQVCFEKRWKHDED